ncbi:hypothetical protein [Undibacterium sp.]|uniref:hypothetical protein n=1 Tax=Undibacterium sp. TaxID=1914977 RepID=UPI003753C223
MKTIVIALLLATVSAAGLSVAQSNIKSADSSKANNVITIQCEEKSASNRCLKVPPPPAPPAPPPPPPPPEEPTPPEIHIPEALHAICAGKAAGTTIKAEQSDSIQFSGSCIKRDGKMVLDIDHIRQRKQS